MNDYPYQPDLPLLLRTVVVLLARLVNQVAVVVQVVQAVHNIKKVNTIAQ